jgi:hypothetical protein
LLDTDPFTTTNGSNIVNVNFPAHDARVGLEVGAFYGATGGNGISAEALNKRHHVTSVIDVDNFTITVADTADASGDIGGSAVAGHVYGPGALTRNFHYPRGGGHGLQHWSARALRTSPTDPPNGAPANEAYGPFLFRETDLPIASLVGNIVGDVLEVEELLSGSIHLGASVHGDDVLANTRVVEFNGTGTGGLGTYKIAPPQTVASRAMTVDPGIATTSRGGPQYSYSRLAAGQLVANVAHMLELPYSTGDATAGNQGIVEYAEKYGHTADRVITWQELFVRADELLVNNFAGTAGSLDYVILHASTASNLTLPVGQNKFVYIDLEHADRRSPDLLLEMMQDISEIAVRAGTLVYWTTHAMTGQAAINNGFAPSNGYAIQQLPGVMHCSILVGRQANPAACTAYLEQQINENLRGPNHDQPIDYSKLMVVPVFGKSSKLMPLDQVTAIGQWMRDKGVPMSLPNRAGQVEGGGLENFINQQLIALYPNLGVAPPDSGLATAELWEAKIDELGGSVSPGYMGPLIILYNKLIDEGIIGKLDMMWMGAGETQLQTSVDLIRRTQGTYHGAYTWVKNSHVDFGGVSGYFNTGWAPGDATKLTLTDEGIYAYLDDVPCPDFANFTVAGASSNANTGLQLAPVITSASNTVGSPQRTSGKVHANAQTVFTTQLHPSNITGFAWVMRDGSNMSQGLGATTYSTTAVVSPAASLSTQPVYIGALNNLGTAQGFFPGKIKAVAIGKHLSTAERAVLQDAFEEFFAAVASLP